MLYRYSIYYIDSIYYLLIMIYNTIIMLLYIYTYVYICFNNSMLLYGDWVVVINGVEFGEICEEVGKFHDELIGWNMMN